jgi:hypothetical protein
MAYGSRANRLLSPAGGRIGKKSRRAIRNLCSVTVIPAFLEKPVLRRRWSSPFPERPFI